MSLHVVTLVWIKSPSNIKPCHLMTAMKPQRFLLAEPFSFRGRRLQFPDSITRQPKRLGQRRGAPLAVVDLCSYRTQAVVDDGGRGAQLLTLIARKAGAIHLQHLGKRRLRLRPSRPANQLTLRRRKTGDFHCEMFATTARQCNNNTDLRTLASTIAPATKMARRRTFLIDQTARTSSAFAPLAASRR